MSERRQQHEKMTYVGNPSLEPQLATPRGLRPRGRRAEVDDAELRAVEAARSRAGTLRIAAEVVSADYREHKFQGRNRYVTGVEVALVDILAPLEDILPCIS